jgi:serine/threonine-protein kinase RsbW
VADGTARSLTVDAGVDRLAEVRAFVRAAARALGASDDSVVDLVQAVDEAATNVIVHGYAGQPGAIDLAIKRQGPHVAVTISDACPTFDPTVVPEPDLSVPPELRRPGGMGVHLIRLATDGFAHRPRGGRGNVLTLARTLRARESEEA